MAMTRRSSPTKKVVKKTTSTKKRAPVSKQLRVLKAQVKKLNKVSYEKVETFSAPAQSVSITSLWHSFSLSNNLNSLFPVWGYNATDLANCDKAYLNRKNIMVSIRQANEPNLIRYTMFLVSLKDQGADSTTFDPATGNLTLANITHYTQLGTDQVRLSPRFFNIHAVRRFTMGYEGSAGPTADTRSERRFRFKITPKQKLIQNPKGNVFANPAFTFPKDPSQNYFIVIFNDNSSADLQDNKCDIEVADQWAVNK